MNQGHDKPRTTILMAKIQQHLTGMVSWMTAQLEVRILEILPRRLVVMEVLVTSNPQRTMMMFTVVMTEATAMCGTKNDDDRSDNI
jgi:hypothetical protein